jgi:hypothetical protein
MVRFIQTGAQALDFIRTYGLLILAVTGMTIGLALGEPAVAMGAAVTVTTRRTGRDGGNLKTRYFKITVAADGDTLDTRLRKIVGVKITNPQESFKVAGTLVGGTIAIADARITTDCKAVVSRDSNAGTDGHLEAVITAGTVTVNSSSGVDTSVVTVLILPPRITGHSISGGTITFDMDGSPDVTGVLVEAKGF